MQVNCEHPNIILNPLLNELISAYGNITIRGHRINFIHPKKQIYELEKSNYSPRHLRITLDDLPNCFVTDYSGTNYPVYIEVPCGHCDVCRQAKVNAFVDRCKLETQLYNCNPLFITLTYDEQHKKECGVCLRDVQLFFKRLRINLYRKGYREKIRYALVAEYGRRTLRPHYHAILWNCHACDILSYEEIRDTIVESWSNGFGYIRLVDPSNDKAFYYTAKYLRKDCNVPEGCNGTFLVCSNRGGSIGAKFIDSLREHAVKTLNTELRYVNKWNGRTQKVQVNRYMLNRLVPSLSRSLPYSLKCRVRRFVYDFNILKHRQDCNASLFHRDLEHYVYFFNKFFYVYNYERNDFHDKDPLRPTQDILREMLQDELFIDEALRKPPSFYYDAVYYASKREPYITKVFLNVDEVDLISKSHRIRRMAGLSKEREIL